MSMTRSQVERQQVFFFIAGLTILIGAGFWFFTTETVDIKISSGQWWFYLLLCFLLIVILVGLTALRLRDRKLLVLLGLIITGLTVGLLKLGMEHQPFDPSNLQIKRGIETVTSTKDFPGEELVDLDVDDDGSILPGYKGIQDGVSYNDLLPSAMDQGFCGSCWAVASASAFSTRYNKLLVDNKLGMSTKPVYSCPNKIQDVQHWHFSPQYMVDSVNDEASISGDCTLGGKCNGNYVSTAAIVAQGGVPNSKCVPYFAADDAPCNSGCGSPTDPNYLFCGGGPGGANLTDAKCVKPPGIRWTSCADGSELVKTVETYEPKLVRGESAMLKELDEDGPIVCGINFYRKDKVNAAWTLTGLSSIGGGGNDSYSSYVISPGYISRPSEDGSNYSSDISLGGHALVVYGYGVAADGTKYWNVRNSWGPQWGINGNSKIIRGYTNTGDNTKLRGAWGIEDQCYAAKVRPYYKYDP